MAQETERESRFSSSAPLITRLRYFDGTESDLGFWDTNGLSDHARHINLVRAMLCRAILDATGRRLSGEQYSDNGHNNEIQRWARKFFRNRHPEPFGWGWTIEVLNLSEERASRIEYLTLKNTTDIYEQAA